MNEDVYMEDEKQKMKNMFGAKKQNAVEKIDNLFMIEMMSVFVLMIKYIILCVELIKKLIIELLEV